MVLGSALAALSLAACGSSESTHQQKIEGILGRPVPNWTAYQEKVQDACNGSYERLGDMMMAVTVASGEKTEAMALNLQILCPDRQKEIEDSMSLQRDK